MFAYSKYYVTSIVSQKCVGVLFKEKSLLSIPHYYFIKIM